LWNISKNMLSLKCITNLITMSSTNKIPIHYFLIWHDTDISNYKGKVKYATKFEIADSFKYLWYKYNNWHFACNMHIFIKLLL
jgi:hypothetical protein